MSGGIVFHRRLDAAQWSKWASVKSHVLGQMGIKESLVGTVENFIILSNKLYGLSVPHNAEFGHALEEIHAAISGMSKAKRRAMRRKNVGNLGYDCNPTGKGIRAALKRVKAKKEKAATPDETKPTAKIIRPEKFKRPSVNAKEGFYASWEWRTVRMEVIKKQGKRCNCCGATPEDLTVGGSRVRLVVDHIKPLSKHWNLRLEPSNLQVLCDECNMGKGAWDETDHRSESQKLIEEQLRYEVL